MLYPTLSFFSVHNLSLLKKFDKLLPKAHNNHIIIHIKVYHQRGNKASILGDEYCFFLQNSIKNISIIYKKINIYAENITFFSTCSFKEL